MYSCTNNLSLPKFDVIIYAKSEQIIMLYSNVLSYVNRFRKSMNLLLLIDLCNILKDAKNRIFNLTMVLTQNENIGDYT